MDKKVYDYWLYSLPAIGKKTFLKLQENGFDSFFLYKSAIDKLPSFLSEKQKASIIKGKKRKEEDLQNIYHKLQAEGIFMTVFGNADYPKKLYEIPDSPAVLFYKGILPCEQNKTIAIIGARNCSEYGRAVAEKFAIYFAKKNIAVVSGMASGIDGYAQKAALIAGGFSIGILGSGVNVCYPAENYGLYKELIRKGCVLSEYLPGENASPGSFPPRNRIISGLADALVVVEAKEKSGTLITVEMALEQGKDVYVVPGRITDELSRGCNQLLWEGAIPAIEPEKIVENLYCMETKDVVDSVQDDASPMQKEILSFLDVTPVHINVLQDKTGKTVDVLCRELLLMELENKVRQVGSNWYQKVIE